MDRADAGIDPQAEGDALPFPGDRQGGVHNGVVDPVVDIEGRAVGRGAYPAAPHVTLVRKDERGGNRRDGRGSVLVVVADSGDDGGDLRMIHGSASAGYQKQQRARQRVVAAVDRVADIVHISRDPAQLTGAGIISELFEDVPGDIGGQSHMRVAMVGEPEHPQWRDCRFDQGALRRDCGGYRHR